MYRFVLAIKTYPGCLNFNSSKNKFEMFENSKKKNTRNKKTNEFS